MRIVVSGTHASGKSTLISDFALRHADYEVFPDPYEEMTQHNFVALDATLFQEQLLISAERLEEQEPGTRVIAERGPADFIAYLEALERLGRRGRSSGALNAGIERARRTARHIDLWVVLPLEDNQTIEVGADEDLELRDAMNIALLDLVDGDGPFARTVIELTGDPHTRLEGLEQAAAAAQRNRSRPRTTW